MFWGNEVAVRGAFFLAQPIGSIVGLMYLHLCPHTSLKIDLSDRNESLFQSNANRSNDRKLCQLADAIGLNSLQYFLFPADELKRALISSHNSKKKLGQTLLSVKSMVILP